MKEVSMKVPKSKWAGCGSTITDKEIKIKISDGLGNQCVTESIKYETHKDGVLVAYDMIVWNTNALLSNCTEMKIDRVKSRLQGIVIQGTDEIKSCIKFIQVVLNDADGTVYERDPISLNKVL